MTAVTITVGAPSKCRSCGAGVVFLNTEGGKVAPFEVDANGRYVVDGLRAKHVGDPHQLELGAVQPVRYTSHFATCPQRDEWRRK